MNGIWAKTSIATACLMCVVSTALAGPQDVRQEPEEPMGHLKLHHVLKEVAPKKRAEYNPPPPPEDTELDEGSIVISEPSTPLDSLGTIEEDKSPFKDNIWRYLTESEALGLIANLPDAPTPSPLLEALRTMLVMEADPPRRNKNNWLTNRTLALMQVGAISDAAALLRQVPESYHDTSFIPYFSYVMLLNGDAKTACSAMEKMPIDVEANYARMHIFCDTVNKKYSKAALALSLLEEAQKPAPEWFSALIDSMEYNGVKIPAPKRLEESTDLAMLLYAGNASIAKTHDMKGLLTAVNKHYHSLVANNAVLPLRWRIVFGEFAALYDTASANKLKAIYASADAEKSGKAITRITAYKKLLKKQTVPHLANAYKRITQSTSLPIAQLLLGDITKSMSTKLPKHPSYKAFSSKAFSMLFLNKAYESLSPWLLIMDSFRPVHAHTFVAHELNRFRKHQSQPPTSSALRLPLLPSKAETPKEERKLLARFYQLMPLFEYESPELPEHLTEFIDTDSELESTIEALKEHGENGSAAGVILTAMRAIGNRTLDEVEEEIIIETTKAIQQCGYDALARDFTAAALLAFF